MLARINCVDAWHWLGPRAEASLVLVVDCDRQDLLHVCVHDAHCGRSSYNGRCEHSPQTFLE